MTVERGVAYVLAVAIFVAFYGALRSHDKDTVLALSPLTTMAAGFVFGDVALAARDRLRERKNGEDPPTKRRRKR